MRRRRVLLPALALGLVLPGVVTAPAWADPPEIATGTIVVDEASFGFEFEDPTGPVERFSFSFTATVSGDLAGRTSEHYDCLQAGPAVHCRGGGTTVAPDGSTATLRATLTCTPLPDLSCDGRSQGRGVTADGERLVWMTDVSATGPFQATYVSRLVHGPG